MNSKQSFTNRSLISGLKCPTAISDIIAGQFPTSDFGIAMDFTQTMTFCNVKFFLKTFATSKGIQGSEGLLPTFIKKEPSSDRTFLIASPTLDKN